jgi:plastocyanin
MTKTRLAVIAVALFVCLTAAACGGSSHKGSSSTTVASGTSTNQVMIKNFAFVPKTITVKVGTTVTWTNEDNVQHSVQWNNNAFPTSALLLAGTSTDTYSHTFTTAGTFNYICGVHNFMTGTVVVTP